MERNGGCGKSSVVYQLKPSGNPDVMSQTKRNNPFSGLRDHYMD